MVIEATVDGNEKYDDTELLAQPGVAFVSSMVPRRFESSGWPLHVVEICHLYVRFVFLLCFGISVGFIFLCVLWKPSGSKR